jgi:hypothetical protein
LWVHKKCSDVRGRLVVNPHNISPRCSGKASSIDGKPVTEVDVDGTLIDVEAHFSYLGDMLCVGERFTLANATKCCTACTKFKKNPANSYL